MTVITICILGIMYSSDVWSKLDLPKIIMEPKQFWLHYLCRGYLEVEYATQTHAAKTAA